MLGGAVACGSGIAWIRWDKVYRPSRIPGDHPGLAIFPVPRIVGIDIDFNVITGHPAQRTPESGGVVIAGVHAVDRVHNEAVLGEARNRRAGKQVVRETAADTTQEVQAIVGAYAHPGHTFKLFSGLLGGNGDSATSGVTAEQSALGSTEHLDPLDVDQVQHGADTAGVVNAVHIQPDTGIRRGNEVPLAHAAQEDRRTVTAPTVGVDIVKGHVGDNIGNLVHPLDAPGLEAVTGEGRNRDGGFLQTLFTFPGRHHHLFHEHANPFGLLGLDRLG